MKNKLSIFGFCMYDFANSAYTTVIITAIYSAFFVSYIADGQTVGDLYWGTFLALSNIAAMILAPLAGAAMDAGAGKKRFLFLATSSCVVFTALLYFPDKSSLFFAGFLIFFSNLGFSLSESIVSSFLPDICEKKDMGKVSGYAWGVGYIGGILSLLLSLWWMTAHDQSISSIKFCCVLTAVFYAICSVPAFLFMKEHKIEGVEFSFKQSYLRIFETFKEISKYSYLFTFLISFLLYNCGIMTIITYAAIYAEQELLFDKTSLITLIIVVNVMSSVGAFIFGFVEDRIGPLKTIQITLYVWIAVVACSYYANSKEMFYGIALITGLVIGATQSSSRAFVGILSPSDKSSEFFGFWGLCSKLSAVGGIYSFGLLASQFGRRNAILANILFFAAGLILTMKLSGMEQTDNS